MAEGIQASTQTTEKRLGIRPFVAVNALWPGVAAIVLVAGGFLLHQLMAWPAHEDETLALFVGRDSLPGVVEHVTRERGGAPLHFLVAWAVTHLGFGLGGLRVMSVVFALASLPLVALLGERLVGRRAALVGTAILAGSWLFLFHGIYARMYSLFLFLSLASALCLLRALDRGGRGPWALWLGVSLLTVAAHPYGVLMLAGQGLYVLVARRERLREAMLAGVFLLVLGIPFWLTDLVLAGRFDVGVGGGRGRLGGPGAVASYLWETAGDASAGWWPVTLAIVVLAVVGVARMRRDAQLLVGAMVIVPTAAFLLARLGGAAAPESRHLIFVAPFFALAAGGGLVTATRRLPAALPVVLVALLAVEIAWTWHRTPPLFEWEPSARQGSSDAAGAWLAASGRPDDLLFGYEPLYLEAWERDDGFSRVVIPRADAALALRVLERNAPLGRAVWVLDASERNNIRPSLEIEERSPTPARAFEVRAFGPFLVVRTREPVGTPARYLALATRVMVLGRSLSVGDTEINMRTVERAAYEVRGYGPSAWLRWGSSR